MRDGASHPALSLQVEGGRWRAGIISVGRRPETMMTRTMMMVVVVTMMIFIEYLCIRYYGMWFTRMITFDSRNDPWNCVSCFIDEEFETERN